MSNTGPLRGLRGEMRAVFPLGDHCIRLTNPGIRLVATSGSSADDVRILMANANRIASPFVAIAGTSTGRSEIRRDRSSNLPLPRGRNVLDRRTLLDEQ